MWLSSIAGSCIILPLVCSSWLYTNSGYICLCVSPKLSGSDEFLMGAHTFLLNRCGLYLFKHKTITKVPTNTKTATIPPAISSPVNEKNNHKYKLFTLVYFCIKIIKLVVDSCVSITIGNWDKDTMSIDKKINK